jgi:hypothetical protein
MLILSSTDLSFSKYMLLENLCEPVISGRRDKFDLGMPPPSKFGSDM